MLGYIKKMFSLILLAESFIYRFTLCRLRICCLNSLAILNVLKTIKKLLKNLKFIAYAK